MLLIEAGGRFHQYVICRGLTYIFRINISSINTQHGLSVDFIKSFKF
jgi:hypothetical protein